MNCSAALRQQLRIYFLNYPGALLVTQPNHRIDPTRWEVLAISCAADRRWPDQKTVGQEMKETLIMLFSNLDRSLVSSGWSANSRYWAQPDGRVTSDNRHRFNFNQSLLFKWWLG